MADKIKENNLQIKIAAMLAMEAARAKKKEHQQNNVTCTLPHDDMVAMPTDTANMSLTVAATTLLTVMDILPEHNSVAILVDNSITQVTQVMAVPEIVVSDWIPVDTVACNAQTKPSSNNNANQNSSFSNIIATYPVQIHTLLLKASNEQNISAIASMETLTPITTAIYLMPTNTVLAGAFDKPNAANNNTETMAANVNPAHGGTTHCIENVVPSVPSVAGMQMCTTAVNASTAEPPPTTLQ